MANIIDLIQQIRGSQVLDAGNSYAGDSNKAGDSTSLIANGIWGDVKNYYQKNKDEVSNAFSIINAAEGTEVSNFTNGTASPMSGVYGLKSYVKDAKNYATNMATSWTISAGSLNAPSGGSSKAWATLVGSEVAGTGSGFSSKAEAMASKNYASSSENTKVIKQDTTSEDGYSSLHHREKSKQWASNDIGVMATGDTGSNEDYSSKAYAKEAQSYAEGDSNNGQSGGSKLANNNDLLTGSAKEWASNPVGNKVTATEYSSKAMANESASYANQDENELVVDASGTNVQNTYSSKNNAEKSKQWAVNAINIMATSNTGSNIDYSSKAYATESKNYANGISGVDPVTGVSGSKVSGGSSKEWAQQLNDKVDGIDSSAKEWAVGSTEESAKRQASGSVIGGSAKEWASKFGTDISTTEAVDGGVYSAKYYATIVQGDGQIIVDNMNDINTVANDLNLVDSNINIVGPNIDNVNIAGNNINQVNTVSSHISNVDTVSGDISNVNKTGEDIASVVTVATDINNVNTVSNSIDNINIVGSNISTVSPVSQYIANVNHVGENIQDVNATAASIVDVNTTADNISDVSTVSASITHVNTVAYELVSDRKLDVIYNEMQPGEVLDLIQEDLNKVAQSDLTSFTELTDSYTKTSIYAGKQAKDSANLAKAHAEEDRGVSILGTSNMSSAAYAYESKEYAQGVSGTMVDANNNPISGKSSREHRNDAEKMKWEAEAEKLTTYSYANEPEDVYVKSYTSNGDGTFTIANTVEYSTKHWLAKTSETATSQGQVFIDLDQTLTNKTVSSVDNKITSDNVSLKIHAREDISAGDPLVIDTTYVFDSSLDFIGVKKAVDDSSTIIGIAKDTLSFDDFGFAVVSGYLNMVDTSSYSDNDNLYIDADGTLTATKPISGVTRKVSTVLRSDESNGLLSIDLGLFDRKSDEISYDNSTSGLSASNVKSAIDEIDSNIDTLNSSASTDGSVLKSIKDNASLASYSQTTGLTSTTITGALDELKTSLDSQNEASEISYNNSTSNLTAVNTQSAIDEIEARVDSLDAKPLNKYDGTVAPIETDDIDLGYTIGSVWIDTVAKESYRLLDPTKDSAVWVNTTLTTDEITALSTSYSNTIFSNIVATVKDALDIIVENTSNLDNTSDADKPISTAVETRATSIETSISSEATARTSADTLIRTDIGTYNEFTTAYEGA